MKMIIKIILVYLLFTQFVHSKDITSIPEVVDFGDCAIRGKAQIIYYSKPLLIVNNSQNILYIIRCWIQNDPEDNMGNNFGGRGLFSEYFENNILINPNDTLTFEIDLSAGIITDNKVGHLFISYKYLGEELIITDSVLITAKTHIGDSIVISSQDNFGYAYCENATVQDTIFLSSILYNITNENYIIDSVQNNFSSKNIFGAKGFYYAQVGGDIKLDLPIVFKPGDKVNYYYDACDCEFGISKSNSIFYLHNEITGNSLKLYDTIMQGSTKLPEIRLFTAYDYGNNQIKIGDSVILRSVGINSCSKFSYTVDSILTEPIWKNGELKFNPIDSTIPYHFRPADFTYINIKFMPMDTGIKQGYLTFFITRDDGEQIKRFYFLETDGVNDFGAVSDNISDPIILVYPNPADDYLMISLKNNDYIENVTVYDLIGNEIINSVGNNSLNYYKLGLSNIQRGSYFLMIKTNKENIIKSFLKN